MKFEDMINTIQLGDCYELIKDIPDNSIDLVLTDPPYEISKGGMTGIFKTRDKIGHKYYDAIMDKKLDKGIDLKILDEYIRILKKINIYIWCNKDQIYNYMNYFVKERKCNFEIIIWGKNDPTPFTCGHYLKDKEYCLLFWEKGAYLKGNYETMRTIYMSNKNKDDGKKYGHPTIKPLNIIKNLLSNSCESGGIVLDTFCGSGTTCVACKETGRRYIGMEIDPEYHKIAVDRLNGITANGQTSIFTDFENLGGSNE